MLCSFVLRVVCVVSHIVGFRVRASFDVCCALFVQLFFGVLCCLLMSVVCCCALLCVVDCCLSCAVCCALLLVVDVCCVL